MDQRRPNAPARRPIDRTTTIDELDSRRKQDHATRFKQQTMKAWSPMADANWVLPFLFLVGIIFIPTGAIILAASNNVMEVEVAYGNETKLARVETKEFNLSQKMSPPIYLFFSLSNFYQNHRRYIKSRDSNQLMGKDIPWEKLLADCEPFRKFRPTNDSAYQPIAPCGAAANSLFNDTATLTLKSDIGVDTPVTLSRTEIAWNTDKAVKFKNPESWNGTAKPIAWQKPASDIGGYENEPFIVWMRPAAFHSFQKLWARIEIPSNYSTLPAGRYELTIHDVFPVAAFSSEKAFTITNTNWLGAKNRFLAIMYMAVGSVCILLGLFCTIFYMNFGMNVKRIVNVQRDTPFLEGAKIHRWQMDLSLKLFSCRCRNNDNDDREARA